MARALQRDKKYIFPDTVAPPGTVAQEGGMAYQIFLFLIVDPISLHMQSVHLIMHL
jgi:hypothetical protein